MALSSTRLMSGNWIGYALDLAREARWWAVAPSSGFSLSALILGAIVVGGICFISGLICGCCLVSARCRWWAWQCITSAHQSLVDPVVVRPSSELQRRFREYRA